MGKKRIVLHLNSNDLLCGHHDCIYRGRAGAIEICDYLFAENRKRPCPPTPECSCYKKGKKKSYDFEF